MKKILFACASAMSTSIVMNALKKEAQKEGLELEVDAVSQVQIEEKLETGWDLIFLAPQIKHKYAEVKAIADKKNITVECIFPQNYSPFGVAGLLKQLKNTLKIQ